MRFMVRAPLWHGALAWQRDGGGGSPDKVDVEGWRYHDRRWWCGVKAGDVVLIRPVVELHGVILSLFVEEDGDEGVGVELVTMALAATADDGSRSRCTSHREEEKLVH
jgi:hypothetical protein